MSAAPRTLARSDHSLMPPSSAPRGRTEATPLHSGNVSDVDWGGLEDEGPTLSRVAYGLAYGVMALTFWLCVGAIVGR